MMSFNYFPSVSPYAYVYGAESQTFKAECPWDYEDVTWVKETDPFGDGWKQKNNPVLCASRHRMRIGIRGKPEDQVPLESSVIISFAAKDTSGWFRKYHYDDTGSHSGTVKITYRDKDGGSKVIANDTISGVKGTDGCPNENYKEYLFDRAGNYHIEACVGKSSGSCAKPKGCYEYDIYVPEKEVEEDEDYTFAPTNGGTEPQSGGIDTSPAPQPNLMLIGMVILGGILLWSSGKKVRK
jgi:hypothetical protein